MATNSKKVKRKPTPPKKASKGKNDASTSKGAANDKKNKTPRYIILPRTIV